MLRAGIPGGSHRVGMRSRRQRDPRNDGGDDQYRICGAADPALHLRSARRSPRRPRDRVLAAVMFPASVILLEGEGRGRHGSSARPLLLVRQIVLNPMVLSILVGSRVGDCRLAHSGAEEKY
jgi:hypothetical protein